MKRLRRVAVSLILLATIAAHADVSKTINTSEINLGYMNVYDTNWSYLWGSDWGVSDLKVEYHDQHTISFYRCPMGDTSEYWYVGGSGPGAEGAKIMQANWYADTQGLHGQTITFSGMVISNTLVDVYSVVAFVKDFAPDYSSFFASEVYLTATNNGAFAISLTTSNDPNRHQQWGLQVNGRNVWPPDLPSKGVITVTQIPEPALAVMAAVYVVSVRRRNKSVRWR